MEESNFEGEITFNNADYLVSIRSIQMSTFDPGSQKLYVEVEDKLQGNIWKGDFQAKYIEDITSKAGVPKKFNIFVKMMIQALKSSTDSVCIDLLTYNDLENLKNKRTTSTASQQNNNPQSTNNKRYFILTYITEFERVHYPLSLNFVEEPEADQLRRTIERMRNMIMMQKSNAFSVQSEPLHSQKNIMNQTAYNSKNNKIDDFASIEVENEHLRRQINDLESQFNQSHQEFYNMSQQKFYTESEYDKYKRDAQKEIINLQDQVRNAEQELAQLQDQLRSSQSAAGSNRVTQTSGFSLNSGQVTGGGLHTTMSDVDHVKRQLEEISSQLDQERSTTGSIVVRQDKEIEECKKELDEQRDNEKKLKAKQRELQEELDQTLRRIEQLQRGISTPVRRKQPFGYTGTNGGGSRNASPYSRNSSGSKKVGTPGSNGGVKSTSQTSSNLYNRQTRNVSNNRGSNGLNNVGGVGVQRQSPQRIAPNTYKPPNQIRQSSNNRQSPSAGLRNPVQRQPYQRNTSSNNRSGSNNNRQGVGSGLNKPVGISITTKPAAYKPAQNQSNSSSVYDRLYGGNKKQSNMVNQIAQEQTTVIQPDNYESLNINIMSASASSNLNNNSQLRENKENLIKQPQMVAQDHDNNYDDVDVKDINSKLSRLQDLLKMAKQT